jgi:hypothetical protein
MRLSALLTPLLIGLARSRTVVIQDGQWTNSSSGMKVILEGTNLVMKGEPWLPAVGGDAICDVSIDPYG